MKCFRGLLLLLYYNYYIIIITILLLLYFLQLPISNYKLEIDKLYLFYKLKPEFLELILSKI